MNYAIHFLNKRKPILYFNYSQNKNYWWQPVSLWPGSHISIWTTKWGFSKNLNIQCICQNFCLQCHLHKML